MDLLFSILLKACYHTMLNMSSQSVGNDTGLRWCASESALLRAMSNAIVLLCTSFCFHSSLTF